MNIVMKIIYTTLITILVMSVQAQSTEHTQLAFAQLQQAQIELLYAESGQQVQSAALDKELSPAPFFISVMKGVLGGFGVTLSSLNVVKLVMP